jgi:hypothetical protein
LSKGAQASDTVFNFFLSKGLVTGSKRKIKIPKKAEEVKSPVSTDASQGGEEPKIEEIKTEVKEELKAETPVEESKVETKEEVKAEAPKEEIKKEEVKAEEKVSEAKTE